MLEISFAWVSLVVWIIVSLYNIVVTSRKKRSAFWISGGIMLIGVIGLATPLNTFMFINLSLILQVVWFFLFRFICVKHNDKLKPTANKM